MPQDEVAESWKGVSKLSADFEHRVAGVEQAFGRGVVLFGAGPHGRAAARHFKSCDVPVRCFVDNDPAKHGTSIDGIEVLPPQEAATGPLVLITARHAVRQVGQQLDAMGVASISFDMYFAVRHIDRLASVRNTLLQDSRSRLVYDSIVKAMLTGEERHCAAVMEANQYFALPQFVNVGNDHFVDAGAYVGDTIERFIFANNGIFRHIYAFEPGGTQMAALERRVKRLCQEWAVEESRITCERAGLSERDEEMGITADQRTLQCTSIGPQAAAGNEISKVRVHSLDRYLDGRPATFIKADIEGMETAMLLGAGETIRKFRPKLAISIYHEPVDLFRIAETVRSLVPDYCMAVRHHAPFLMDSVLYCWMDT
jgi:FkbM family methyltransferase